MQPRSQGLLRFQDGGVDPGNEVGCYIGGRTAHGRYQVSMYAIYVQVVYSKTIHMNHSTVIIMIRSSSRGASISSNSLSQPFPE